MTSKYVKPADYLFWAVKQTGLSHLEFRVLVTLCDIAGENGCYPSQTTVADRCQSTRQEINKVCGQLEKKGLIRKKQNFKNNGAKSSNSYEFPLVKHVGSSDIPCSPEHSSPVGSSDIPMNAETDIKHPVLNTHSKQERVSRGFKRPTLEQIKERCQEMGYPIDAEKFFLHYESNGWKVGKNSMKNWSAALAGWNKREGERNGKINGNTIEGRKLSGAERTRRRREELRRLEQGTHSP